LVWALSDPCSPNWYCTARGFNISIFHCKNPFAFSKNKKWGSAVPANGIFLPEVPVPRFNQGAGRGANPGKFAGWSGSTGLFSQLIQHLQDMLSFEDQVSQAVIADSFLKPVIESELFVRNGGFEIFKFNIGKRFQHFANFI
jgi:hypothetical protein